MDITIRKTIVEDLELFYEFQLNEEARYMAAFSANSYKLKDAYLLKFGKLLMEPTVNMQTIVVDGIVVGTVSKFEMHGNAELTYWIERSRWGQGIASKALKLLLEIEPMRPIYGAVAFDNIGSQKVLEHCGFSKVGTDSGFAEARGQEVAEFIYRLD